MDNASPSMEERLLLSPGFLRRTLLQPSISPRKRMRWIGAFAFGSAAWSLLGQVGEPRACPTTRDPFLLALRRLCWPQVGELSAMHRVAALEAANQTYGFLRLVLEEAAALDNPAESTAVLQEDAFKAILAIIKKQEALLHQQEYADLRLRGILYKARRQIAFGDSNHALSLNFARTLISARPPRDRELEPLFLESLALAAERAGKVERAAHLQSLGVDLQFKTMESPRDRRSEMMVALAELKHRLGHSPQVVEMMIEIAAMFLRFMPPGVNQPLRRRLAAFGR